MMRKLFLSALLVLMSTIGIQAETFIKEVAVSDILTWFTGVTFSFSGTNMPIETQHHLVGLKMTFSEDGEQVTMHINDTSVTYAIDSVAALSYFRGTPSVTLSAHEDPQHAGEYYTSFYSGLEAYAVPDGVTAYTAVLNAGNNTVTISPVEGGVISQGMAVLLKAASGEFTMETIEPVLTTNEDNVLRGSDVLIARPVGTIYVLSSKKLAEDVVETMAFYKYTGSDIPANKAYIELPAGAPAPARIVWNQHVPTDIENSLDSVESAEKFIRDGQIYIRKGEHIYNGQGMLVR